MNMGSEDLVIDPWSSAQSTDYSRIIEQFGLSSMDSIEMPSPSRLHRRGIVFAHRDLEMCFDWINAEWTDAYGAFYGY
jgi:tryptophanyl-tRNA synthetase